MPNSLDVAIQSALAQAELALNITSPNPRVGAYIVTLSGATASGHTQAAGSAHAEVMALRDAAIKGLDLNGATLYVTLEPCSHQGRTGPCADAVIASGISRVVASLQDPNPLVAGHGFARLRAAGIDVLIGPGAQESRRLNLGFFSRMVRKRPWVRLKIASSLDGITALANGQSQWITSEAARADGHTWRARACATLTGVGTVLSDNPRLDARAPGAMRQPTRVVVDSQLQTPLDAAILKPTSAVWVYGAQPEHENTERVLAKARLEAVGADVRLLPTSTGKVDLQALMADLGTRQVNELHVEAGAKLNGSLLKVGLVDELLVYMAPKMLGSGMGWSNFGPLTQLSEGLDWDWLAVDKVGQDVRLLAHLRGASEF